MSSALVSHYREVWMISFCVLYRYFWHPLEINLIAFKADVFFP